MDIIIEIDKFDKQTIAEVIQALEGNYTLSDENGLDGGEIVTITIALIPAIKDLIMHLFPKKTVSIKISTEIGTIELTANSQEELEVLMDKYINLVKEPEKNN